MRSFVRIVGVVMLVSLVGLFFAGCNDHKEHESGKGDHKEKDETTAKEHEGHDEHGEAGHEMEEPAAKALWTCSMHPKVRLPKSGSCPTCNMALIPLEAEEPAAKTEFVQKTCPLMGGAINKKIYTDHNGRRIYFCCAGCVSGFKKDPAKYLKKVDAEIQKAKDAAKSGN